MAYLTIQQKADTVGTLRHVSVFLMETLARWTPLTPEFEVKVLFGRHIWEFAQHADALGLRTAELRSSLHFTRPPVAAFQEALDRIAGLETSAERVAGIYGVCLPDLTRRVQNLRNASDRLLDQPSIRLFERMLADYARLDGERHDMLAGIDLGPPPAGWSAPITAALDSVEEFADFRPAKEGVA
jgi:hypothetical protein